MQFKAKLDGLGVPTSPLKNYSSGHAVPQTAGSLATVYNFFNQYLTPPSVLTKLENPVQISESDIQLSVSPNPASEKLQLKYSISAPGRVSIALYNLSGIKLYNTENQIKNAGMQTETIYFENLNLPTGIYYIKVVSDGMQRIQKFLKK